MALEKMPENFRIVTRVLMKIVMLHLWDWRKPVAVLTALFFLLIDVSYFKF